MTLNPSRIPQPWGLSTAVALIAAAISLAACSEPNGYVGGRDGAAGSAGAVAGGSAARGAGAGGHAGSAQGSDAGDGGSSGRPGGRAGTGDGGTGGANSAAGAGAGASGGAGMAGRDGEPQNPAFPGDTYLPWAGGAGYFARWSNGPPSDPDFVPIAVWLQSPPNAQRYKDVGINLFIGLWEGPTEEQLSTLASAGVPTFCDQSRVWSDHLDDATVWGWLQQDEPDNAQAREGGGYDPCIDPAQVVARYDAMVASDSTRPVWLNLGRGVSDTEWVGRGECTGNTDMYQDYAMAADILSFDIYPVNGGVGLEAVPKGIDNLRMWSNYEKPVIAAIEGSNIDDTTRPTPAQIKSEVWMALIHGAAGILYFCHRFSPTFSETDCLDNATTAEGLARINAQLAELAPVLNTPAVGNGVTVESSDESKPVDVMLKRSGAATYLFAAEMRGGQTTATFRLRDFPATASAEVLGENRTLDVVDGVFEDDFADYGVHLYAITQ